MKLCFLSPNSAFLGSCGASLHNPGWVKRSILLCFAREEGSGGFPGDAVVKNLPTHKEDSGVTGLIPGIERSPGVGNGNPLHYFCLGNLMDRGAWWIVVQGFTKSWTWLSMQHEGFGEKEKKSWEVETRHDCRGFQYQAKEIMKKNKRIKTFMYFGEKITQLWESQTEGTIHILASTISQVFSELFWVSSLDWQPQIAENTLLILNAGCPRWY